MRRRGQQRLEPRSSGVEEALLVSSPGFGIIDSGCGRTLTGQATLNTVFRMLKDKEQGIPTLKKKTNVFRFRNGLESLEEVSEKVVRLPVGTHGKTVIVKAAVIQGDAPLLLSRSTMKSLRAVIDFEKETLLIQGDLPRPLATNSAGQFVIDVMNFEPHRVDALVSESADEIKPEVKEKVSLRENHCIMAHAGAWTKGSPERLKCLVAELFSPPRFSTVAEQYGKKSLAFDILQGWNLNDRKTQQQVDQLLVDWGGWYHLNQQHLKMLQRCHNRRIAQKQADFVVQQIKKQLGRGGRVLVEHPWSSNLWKYPPMAKLLQRMHLCRSDLCAYELSGPDSGLPVKKPTGLAVSHPDMTQLTKCCPGHSMHTKTSKYTEDFCRTWLSCVLPETNLCSFACLQDQMPQTSPPSLSSEVPACLSLSEVLAARDESPSDDQVKTELRKLHNNLGHPTGREMVRVLKSAGGSEQALRLAADFKCDICFQRQRPTPCLPASAHQIVDFNHRVGLDVKKVPGWETNRVVSCLNVVDFASGFPMMHPFFEVETGELLRSLFQKGWEAWAGAPVEVMLDPARTNISSTFLDPLELSGTRVLTSAAEAHNQLGKVEKQGHLLLDQVQPTNREEFEQCVLSACTSKNEMLNSKGLSPAQCFRKESSSSQ